MTARPKRASAKPAVLRTSTRTSGPTVKMLLAQLEAERDAAVDKLLTTISEYDLEVADLKQENAQLTERILKLVAELADAKALPIRGTRNRMDDERTGLTRKFTIVPKVEYEDPFKVYVVISYFADGKPGELFVKCDRQGSLASGAFDAFAVAVSIGLQYGVPLSNYVNKMVAMRFEPSGRTTDGEFPSCTSVLDLIGRWLSKLHPPEV